MLIQERITPNGTPARKDTPWYWDGEILFRRCAACNEIKPLEAYDKSNAKGYRGIRSYCKDCRIKERKSNKQYRQKYAKRYYAKNKEKFSEYSKKNWKKYYDDNKKRISDYKSAWRKENLSIHASHEAKRRTLKNINGSFLVLPKELKRLNSSPCFFCGSHKGIAIDHIIPISRGGSHSIGNLQPLCQSCNSSKGSLFISELKHKYKERSASKHLIC